MKKVQSGFSLVEVLLAVSVLGLIVIALVGSLIYGQESTVLSGARSRATMLADEGLEAVRNIRDAGFSNLTDGPHGLAISGNQWTLSGTSDTTDIFTRSLTITSVDANRKQVISNVTWSQTPQRSGAVILTTYFTDWNKSTPIGSCDIYCQSLGSYATGTCRENPQQCTNNSETYESGGDVYCTGGENADTCCCKP
ncbi:MAG: prepilin-type N-terminal cleavage/methylation domain-containing protein [Candidatus Daviesbacteria bacterium]|nr:prepilin-type N-terminal cleavage/methylation domain-containing protein [Candidatus Daviesbacteria bacterium]